VNLGQGRKSRREPAFFVGADGVYASLR